MYFDNLTGVVLVIVIILILVTLILTIHNANTNKKIHKLANQFSLIQRNEKANALCTRISHKHPELCVGIDYTLNEKGDEVEIEEWNSSHPRPDA